MFLLALALAAPPAADYPQAVLKNDRVAVTVRLPDAQKGFYRGTRFDWAGVVGPVEFNGHKIFGPWKDAHDPANHDDIVGPVEEFGMTTPLGYADAKEGETFLKIGVGELVKPKEEKYRFHHNYQIKYPGAWEVEVGGSEVEFRQGMLAKSGYGYKYAKTVRLEKAGAGFAIEHVLTNTGTKAIDTDCYNHNFFNVDGDTIGPAYTLAFSFTPKAPAPKERFAELVKLDRTRLTFTGALDKGSVYAELTGYGTAEEDHRVFLTHTASGVRMNLIGDRPVSKFNLWGTTKTICPEPYVAVKLKPGETMKWGTRYFFSMAGLEKR